MPQSPMDYRSMQHAIALADEGSFVRAAEKVALKRRSLSPAAMHLLDQLRQLFRPRTA